MFRPVGDSLALTNVPVPRTAGPTDSATPVPVSAWLAVKRFIRSRSHLVRLAERATMRTAWLQGFGLRTGLIEAPATTIREAGRQETVPDEFSVFADSLTSQADSALSITAKLLTRMQSRTRAAGGEFAVLIVPSIDDVYPPGAPQSVRFSRSSPMSAMERPGERLAQICVRAEVICTDPTGRFVAAARALSPGDLLVFPQDGHWNRNGHAVAAEALAEIVREAMAKSNGGTRRR
jgi:hypothetical protein